MKRRAPLKRKRRGAINWRSASVLTAICVVAIGSFAVGTAGMSALPYLGEMAAAASGNTVSATAPKTCEAAKKKALRGEKDNDGPAKASVTGTAAGQKIEADECYSAFMKEEGKKKKQKGIRLTAEDYDCYGRQAQTNVKTGSVTDISMPSKAAKEGKCLRSVNDEIRDKNSPNKEDPKKDDGKGNEKPPEMPKMEPPKDDKKDPPPPPPQDCQANPQGPNCPQKQSMFCGVPLISSFVSCPEQKLPDTASTDKAADQIAGVANDTGGGGGGLISVTPGISTPAADARADEKIITPVGESRAIQAPQTVGSDAAPGALDAKKTFTSPQMSGFTGSGDVSGNVGVSGEATAQVSVLQQIQARLSNLWQTLQFWK